MALKNIKDLFSGSSDDEKDLETTELGGLNKMILVEPRAYSEAKEIVKYLSNESSVVVNLKKLGPDVAKRIYDYLSGAVFAMDGNIRKISSGIFICAPKSITLQGDIKEDKSPAKTKDDLDF